MPYSMRIDAEAGVVVRTVTGPLSVDEIVESRHELFEHPEFHSDMNVLWDLGEASLDNLLEADLRMLVGRIRQHQEAYSGDYKVAVVVPRVVDYGISRQFQALASTQVPFSLKPFRSAAEAWQWLTTQGI